MAKPLTSKIFNFDSKIWNFYLPMMFIALGVIFRGWTYLQNQCLWQDEAVWTNDIMGRTGIEILMAADGYKIQMPVGLGTMVKCLVTFWGTHEYVWRLIPFLFSIAAIFFFDYLLRLIANPFVRCFALALLAVLNLPVYYTSELRAYSIDLCGILILFRALIKVREDPDSLPRGIFLLLAGCFLPWLSFAPLFVLPAILFILFLDLFLQKKFNPIMSISAFFVWGINFINLYYIFYKKLNDCQYYRDVLQDGFPPYPLSWKTLVWPVEHFQVLLNSTGFEWPLISLLFAAFGFYHLLKGSYKRSHEDSITPHRQFIFQLSCVVLFLVFFAAACHKYPLKPRLQLFLVPVFLWFMAEGLNIFITHKSRWIKICAALLAVSLLISSAWRTWHDQLWVKPDMKSALQLLTVKQKQGDHLLLVEASQYAFFYYLKNFSYPLYLNHWAYCTYPLQNKAKKSYIALLKEGSRGRLYEDGTIQWLKDTKISQPNFKAFLPPGRLWVLFSDSYDETFLLKQLNQNGRKLYQWNDYRIDLYLYEFPKN